MKKWLIGLAFALLVLVLPNVALATDVTDPTADNTTTTITNWSELTASSSTYTLQNGDILDLSKMTTSPESKINIVIEEGDATSTIIGNPNYTFSNISLSFGTNTGAKYVHDPTNISLRLQDYRTSNSLSGFNQWRTDYDVTIEYAGEVYIEPSSGSEAVYFASQTAVDLTFKGDENSKLVLGGAVNLGNSQRNKGDVSLTFDGGAVECKYIGLGSETSASVTVKDCDLTINSCFAYTLSGNTWAARNDGIYVSPSSSESESSSIITIDNSTVTVIQPNIIAGSYVAGYGPESTIGGGIVGGDKIEIKNGSVVSAQSHSTNSYSQPYTFGVPAIGNTGDIVITDSTVVAEAQYIAQGSRAGGNSAGIGGVYDSITITGSDVTAIGYHGAGIGRGSYNSNSEYWPTSSQSITITNSTVNAYSTYGAGIGSSWMSTGDSKTSDTDVSISGDSNVTAVSQYGTGIGAGATSTEAPAYPLEFTLSVIAGWQGDIEWDIVANSLLLNNASVSEPRVSPMANSDVTGLATDNGTLTLSADAKVNAESGVKAVSLSVNAGTPMMEYTLADSETLPEVSTPINRSTTAGQDTGAGAPSYNLRPDFRSLAFWPVAVGSYNLSYGTTDPDPLLDETDNSDTFTLNAVGTDDNDALQSFTVVRQKKLGGSVTLDAGTNEDTDDGKVISGTTLTAALTDLTPSGVQTNDVTYQWYKDDQEIPGLTNASYTTTSEDDGSVIYCVVTGTGRYRGTVISQAVTVANTPGDLTVVMPSVTSEDEQITATSITLDTVAGYEYGIMTAIGIQWQDSPTFSNLQRNTEYSFVQRAKDDGEGQPGATSAAASFTTPSGKPALPVITITDYENETFTINEDGVSVYSDSQCAEGSKITGSRITDYIGETIYAKYDDETTANEDTVTFVTVQPRPEKPNLIQESISATQNSLSLNGEAGVEYGIFYPDNETNVPDKTISCNETDQTITFDGLSSNTEYVIRARKPATDNSFASTQIGARVSTTAAKTTIAIVPGENTFSYDGTGHGFAFTVLPSGAGTGGFTIAYSKVNGAELEKVEGLPTDIGTYNVSVNRGSDNNYNAVNNYYTGGLTITKGTATQRQDITVTAGTMNVQSVAVDFNSTTYGEAISYDIGTVEGSDYLNTNPSVSNGVLTYQLKAGTSANTIIKIPVIVSTETYDVTVTVTITVTNQQTATVNVKQDNGVYGTVLADPTVTIIDGNGNPLTGNYRVEYAGQESTEYTTSALKPTLPGNYIVTVYYDANGYYGTGSANFTISKADIKLTLSGSADSMSQVTLTLSGVPEDSGVKVEYARSTSAETPTEGWQESPVFQNLTAGTTYYFFAQVTGNDCYNDASATATVTTVEKSVSTISILSQPTQLTYKEGETLDLTGLVIHVTYNDGTSEDITWDESSGLTASPAQGTVLNAEEHDGVPVQITYGGATTTVGTLTVNASSTPEGPSGPSSPTYRVTIDDLLHGSISSNHTWASAGTKVTLTITPDDGYQLDALTVTDHNGATVDYTTNADGSITFTMPRSGVTVSATFSEGTPTPEPSDAWPFVDVSEGDWFYDPVAWAYEQGLMTGTSATTFEPNISTTRGMIVAILHRLEDSPVVNYAMTFDDVADGDWYAEAVRWAASEGIVAGYSDAQFGPNDPITREQMAAILYNYAEWKGYDVSARADLSGYSDQPSAWAVEVMQWAKAEGLINGTTATTLDPQGHATRAQVAAILQRFLEN